MIRAGFSTAILKSMLDLGYAEAEVARIVSLSRAKFSAVLCGKAELTDRQLEAIERATGTSVAQLAALHLEPSGGPYTELANALARCVSDPKVRPAHPRVKPNHRRAAISARSSRSSS